MEQEVIIYGIRHLSSAGAFHLRELLERVKPAMVLVEGPSDMTEQMEHIVSEDTKPPIAIMAYTKETPIKTILYPLYILQNMKLSAGVLNIRCHAALLTCPLEHF